MKATEVIKLMAMLKAFPPKEDKMPRRRGPPKFVKQMDDHDVLALMHKRLEEAQALENFLKEREKINKKEEKKDDKKGLSFEQIAMLLVLTYPVVGLILWMKFH